MCKEMTPGGGACREILRQGGRLPHACARARCCCARCAVLLFPLSAVLALSLCGALWPSAIPAPGSCLADLVSGLSCCLLYPFRSLRVASTEYKIAHWFVVSTPNVKKNRACDWLPYSCSERRCCLPVSFPSLDPQSLCSLFYSLPMCPYKRLHRGAFLVGEA